MKPIKLYEVYLIKIIAWIKKRGCSTDEHKNVERY